MTDPIITTALEAAFLYRLFGPSADYVGSEIRKFIEDKGKVNLGNIFLSAKRKLGERFEAEGAVPPKILKEIIFEGSFCEDQLAAEYFGGVLAASKSNLSKDDRGAALVKLISDMSSYQIRAHYLFYKLFKIHFDGETHTLGTAEGRSKIGVFVPGKEFQTYMELEEGADPNLISDHILVGLSRLDLISDYSLGSLQNIKKWYKDAQEGGLVVFPSMYGVELFFWAHGHSHLTSRNFFDKNIQFEDIPSYQMPAHHRRVNYYIG